MICSSIADFKAGASVAVSLEGALGELAGSFLSDPDLSESEAAAAPAAAAAAEVAATMPTIIDLLRN